MFKRKKFQGKKACVLGMGKSGRAAALLLHDHGFKVLISEEAPIRHISSFSLPKGIETEAGGHTEKVFKCDFIVKSPGIYPKHPVLKAAKKLKIPVFSELEVALAFAEEGCTVLAVTGTNGKTTTTTLLGEIFKAFVVREQKGRNVFVTGNIGTPVSEVTPHVRKEDFLIIEVSSYQLEDSSYFQPQCACIVNITPDHLEHHGGLLNYLKAKAKVTRNQREADTLVVNAADSACVDIVKRTKARVLAFSTTAKHTLKTDVFFDGDEIIFSEGHRIKPPQLQGIHNVENAMAAALMSLAVGVDIPSIQEVFNRFEGVEHRIEAFAYHHGVTYVNDSKATNIESTITALKSFERSKNIWLILGGQDKGLSYALLLPHLRAHCKRILAIGSCIDKIKKDLRDEFPLEVCGDLDHAINYAFEHAVKGDIVLLSPACASFDQFKNFEERGRIFKKMVNERILKERTRELA